MFYNSEARGSNSAVSLLSKRQRQARISFIDSSMKRALVLYNNTSSSPSSARQEKETTFNQSQTSSGSTNKLKSSVLNLNLDLPSNGERLDQIKFYYDLNELSSSCLATKQVKLEEKTRIKSVEREKIKSAERRGLIKMVPAVAYCQAIESTDTIRERQLKEKAIEEARYIVSNKFTAYDEANKKLAEKHRLQIQELKRKKSQELKELLDEENREQQERNRLKAIEDANRQRILDKKTRRRALRQAKAKSIEEARLNEEKRELLRQIESARIRDQEMEKVSFTHFQEYFLNIINFVHKDSYD